MSENSTRTTDDTAPEAEHIDSVDAFDRLLSEKERVLVDFYAEWCGPCNIMAPTVDEFAAETGAEVVKIDVEELPEIATRYDVKSVPTFMAFRSGEVAERLIGLQEKATLAEAVE
jgi:thioredoxin 1